MVKIKMGNVKISGAKVGIRTEGANHLDISNSIFDGVETPFDLSPETTGKVTDVRIVNDPKHTKNPPHGQSGLHSRRGIQSNGVTKGWRRLIAPPLPVYCPECKNIFASKNYVFAGTYFYCWGNTEECIVCGYEKAELSKGVFDLSQEAAVVLRSPEITLQMLERLAEIGSDAIAGKLSPDEIVQAVTDVHPKLGELASRPLKTASWCLAIYLAVLGAIDLHWSVAQKVTDSVLVQQIVKTAFYQLEGLNDQQRNKIEDRNENRSNEEKGIPEPVEGIKEIQSAENDGDGDEGAAVEAVEPDPKFSVPAPKPKPHG